MVLLFTYQASGEEPARKSLAPVTIVNQTSGNFGSATRVLVD